jgi:glycosyltransferase involved in cell wall biosynthesis
MRVGLVVDGTDQFLRPIERELRERYPVQRFVTRFITAPIVGSSVNKLLLEAQFRSFLSYNHVVFFEWAGSLLVKATHLPKRCRIITRLHSIEVASAAHLVDWSQVDTVIVVSEQMRRRLLEVAETPPRRICVVHNGIDLDRFSLKEREFRHRLGMIARVVPVKRVYEAVLVLYELRRQGYRFTLSVGGPLGDDLEPRYPWAVRELIERLGVREHVHLLGPIANPDSFYQDVDVFLSNSFWEGQQSALLEAMASGCYCLSHCWGGVEEVLPPEQVFVTDGEAQEKLIVYANLPPTAKRAAQVAMRRTAEQCFDEDRMVSEIMEMISQLAT